MDTFNSHEPPKEQNKRTRAEFLADVPSPRGRQTEEDHNDIFYDPSYVVDPEVIDHTLDSYSSEVVVDSVLEGEVKTATFEAATNQCDQIETYEQSVRQPKSSIKRSRKKYPPPSDEIVFGYHENDVLCGRGATINAHAGNIRFRKLCVSRKSEFDIGTNSHKRWIATSVVEEILKLDPPGRFLERVDGATESAFDEQYQSSFDGGGGIDKIMTGSSLQYFRTMGYTAKNKTLIKHLGPWKPVGVERAIQKACGVIRDHKRPDKVALRAMSKKKKSSRDGEPRITHMEKSVLAADFSQDESLVSEHFHLLDEKITPTSNDVLIGRGAFINSYIGNVKFRTFASQQKHRFDMASGSEKRAISLELVMQIKALSPPGRFLRRPHSAIHQPVPLSNGKYQIAPRGVDGPWEEVSLDIACLKVCQSMRDLKPDYALPHSHDERVYNELDIQSTEKSNKPSQPSEGSITSTVVYDNSGTKLR
ncbi:hypothetical protein HJC23_007624 [Cyclotella cryptica]|uniref:DUF6824 domain-containing protein n=1 Tax=Cyclotella cryptica TaxID=29204 RepID=A0ABD3QRJ9_9STRA|eukprot:CCRYP_002925-RA/>CCRYP_002925-RA protein AED:0.03 eAED:0.03 QI:164/1/1/1/1/1/2/58/476